MVASMVALTILTANLFSNKNLHARTFFTKHTHAGSIVNTTLPACYIYDLFPSRIPFEPLVWLGLLVLLPLLSPVQSSAYMPSNSRLYTLHPTLYTPKKSHSPCVYAIFFVSLHSNIITLTLTPHLL